MTVRIDSLETDVTVEPPRTAAADRPDEAAQWEELARIATHRARLLQDELRTRAQGFDD